MDCSLPDSSVHRDAPGKNTGVGCHALLQRLFPSQGLNPGLPDYGQILYCLSQQGSPRILEWVAYPFSRGSYQPRNRTGVFRIAGGFFISWATREALFVTTSVLFSTLWTFHMLSINHLLWKKSQKGKQIFLSYRKVIKVFFLYFLKHIWWIEMC